MKKYNWKDEIERGSVVCQRLKNLYFSDIHFSKCYNQVAEAFTFLKKQVAIFHPEKDKLELIEVILTMSNDDVRDLMDDYFKDRK